MKTIKFIVKYEALYFFHEVSQGAQRITYKSEKRNNFVLVKVVDGMFNSIDSFGNHKQKMINRQKKINMNGEFLLLECTDLCR